MWQSLIMHWPEGQNSGIAMGQLRQLPHDRRVTQNYCWTVFKMQIRILHMSKIQVAYEYCHPSCTKNSSHSDTNSSANHDTVYWTLCLLALWRSNSSNCLYNSICFSSAELWQQPSRNVLNVNSRPKHLHLATSILRHRICRKCVCSQGFATDPTGELTCYSAGKTPSQSAPLVPQPSCFWHLDLPSPTQAMPLGQKVKGQGHTITKTSWSHGC